MSFLLFFFLFKFLWQFLKILVPFWASFLLEILIEIRKGNQTQILHHLNFNESSTCSFTQILEIIMSVC